MLRSLTDAPRTPRIDVWRGRPLPDVLARYGVGPELVANEHGKPAPAGGGLHVNLTHTGDLLLVAVSADREVGIDAERPRPRRDLLGLARHGLTDTDRAALQAAPEAEREALFYRLWVRREAAVKCLGTGLGAAPAGAHGLTVVDAELGGIPVAVAAAGPIELRWV